MKTGTRRSKKAPAPIAVAKPVELVVPRAEDEPLCPGTVVMLPEGGIAVVQRIDGRDAYVIEWQKQLGRGPWIFPISELVPV